MVRRLSRLGFNFSLRAFLFSTGLLARAGAAAVLSDQLLCAIISRRFLQLLYRLRSSLREIVNSAFLSLYPPLPKGAHCPSHAPYCWKSTCESEPVCQAPVLVAEDEEQNEAVEEVDEGRVEGEESDRASRTRAGAFEAK